MSLVALIVDDSMLIRHTVCRFLETRGFKVETVSDGVAALEALKTIQPDVIFTDLLMPRLSGTELISALQREHGNRRHSHCGGGHKALIRRNTGNARPRRNLQRSEY